jgi:hypothetical protein
MPIVQRRSRPVNGSVLAFALLEEVLLLVPGPLEEAGVPFSFEGDVPALGVAGVCWEPLVVGVVPEVGVVPVVGVVPEVGVVPDVPEVGVVPEVDVVGGGGVCP